MSRHLAFTDEGRKEVEVKPKFKPGDCVRHKVDDRQVLVLFSGRGREELKEERVIVYDCRVADGAGNYERRQFYEFELYQYFCKRLH